MSRWKVWVASSLKFIFFFLYFLERYTLHAQLELSTHICFRNLLRNRFLYLFCAWTLIFFIISYMYMCAIWVDQWSLSLNHLAAVWTLKTRSKSPFMYICYRNTAFSYILIFCHDRKRHSSLRYISQSYEFDLETNVVCKQLSRRKFAWH